MTLSSVVALRKGLHSVLSADASLSAMLGGARVFDEAPRGVEPPYVTFGDARTRDWSTASDRGAEHFAVVDVWSVQRGEREALSIAARVQDLLDDVALVLENHHLVNLRFVQIETRRENQGRFTRASLRFRAVTEAL
jgi:hypothetical protein